MSDINANGPATVEELLGYVTSLARLTREAQKDAQLVRQEVRTSLQKFDVENKVMLAKTEAIQKSYAPDVIIAAGKNAEKMVDRLGAAIEETLTNVTRQVGRLAVPAVMQTVLWAVIVSACLAFAGWVVTRYTPNLTEMVDRRAELQSLHDQIATEARKLETLKSRLIVASDGRRYVPYRDKVKLCADQNRQETCALYVPVD